MNQRQASGSDMVVHDVARFATVVRAEHRSPVVVVSTVGGEDRALATELAAANQV